MYNIKFTPAALDDLKDIKTYISIEFCNNKAAINLINKIIKKIKQLQDFPESGTSLSSIIHINIPYRYLVCDNYNIFYKLQNDNVLIFRIIYNKRNFMQILFNKAYYDENE